MKTYRDYYKADINELTTLIADWCERKGFESPLTILGEDANDMLGKLALVHSEVSEAISAVRDGNFDNFKEEMADIIIRVLQLVGSLGAHVDMKDEIATKMEINEQRPRRHGKKTSL